MDIVEWQQSERIMSRQEIDEFYESPLPDITVFRFETARLQLPEHHGSFSLKSVRSGKEHYLFSGRSVALHPQQVLLINAGERYASDIDEHTESLSIFYRQFEFSQAINSLRGSLEKLLDQDGSDTLEDVAQIVFHGGFEVQSAFAQLHMALDAEDEEEANEAAMFLLLSVLRQNYQLAPPLSLRSIKKRATRDELFSRVLKAKDYLDASHGQGVDLDRLATVACLSRYHFLRVFTEVVGQTPVAYGRYVRLCHAQESLQQGGNLFAVARAAGYSTSGAFIRAYKRQFNTTPTKFPVSRTLN